MTVSFRLVTLLCLFTLSALAISQSENPSSTNSTAATSATASSPATTVSTGPAADELTQAKSAIEVHDWATAYKHLKKAKKLAPRNPEIYTLIGDYHTAYSRGFKAIKFYQKADELQKAQVANR